MSIVCRVSLCREPSLQDLTLAHAECVSAGAQSVLVLACEDNGLHLSEWNQWLRSLTLPVFGGVFPQLIYADELLSRGVVLVGLATDVRVHSLPLTKGLQADWHQRLRDFQLGSSANQTIMVMVDGLASHIETLLEAIYSTATPGSQALGCGAGSLRLTPTPCLFTQAGVLADAAVIAVMPVACQLGVSHGWEVFAGPFLVTHAEGNRVHTLNYKPALKVYRAEIERNSHRRFANSEFLDIAKTHPFGIINVDGELLVRDPIAQHGDSLICVGEVPANAMVYLLKGVPEQLIASAAAAAKTAAAGSAGEQPLALLFDCISRSLFLNEAYPQEVAAVRRELADPVALVGALSLGEICSSARGPIELLNKSTVVAVF